MPCVQGALWTGRTCTSWRRAAIALACLSSSATAQEAPPRPRLPDGADSNSARAYYALGLQHVLGLQHGTTVLRRRPTVWNVAIQPREAHAAFYWASRLEPLSADAAFGQYVALLMTDERRLQGYLDERPRTLATPEVRAIDSLLVRALMLDPFLSFGLIESVWTRYLQHVHNFRGRSLTRDIVRQLPPHARAMVAYARGEFQQAVDFWEASLRTEPRAYWRHADRARAFARLGELDSAQADLEAALLGARKSGAEQPPYAYQSRSEWEYSLGRIFERQGNLPAAGQAYQRAVTENLGFYPAHLRLAIVALRSTDTVTALTELSRALAVHEADYAAQLTMGQFLVGAGRPDSAVWHLRRAAELEPWASAAQLALARALAAANRTGEAAETYRRFLASSPRDAPQRDSVRIWLSAHP